MMRLRISRLKAFVLLTACLLSAGSLQAQDAGKLFPEIEGYVLLRADLHTHTVFSDGEVWPSIRIREAKREGLDVISITDHLEYQPKSDDIPHPDRNRGYELALAAAEGSGLIVINGAEVTRSMPLGHVNAIFIQDANMLLDEDPVKVLEEARRQGAYIFWNHPDWTAQKFDGVAELTDLHRELLEKDLIDGIEIVNQYTYSEEALRIARDHKLTLMGNSDIHSMVEWDFPPAEGQHRPQTLILASERSEEAVREALMAGRTVVWYKGNLIGFPANLNPLLKASLSSRYVGVMNSWAGTSTVQRVVLENHSGVDMLLENVSGYSLHDQTDIFRLPAHSKLEIKVKTVEEVGSFELRLAVLNALSGPDLTAYVILPVDKPAE